MVRGERVSANSTRINKCRVLVWSGELLFAERKGFVLANFSLLEKQLSSRAILVYLSAFTLNPSQRKS